MTPETGPLSLPEKKPTALKKRVLERALDTPLGHFAIQRFVNVAMERGPERLFRWEGKRNIQLLASPLEEGCKVVVVSNHVSQGDGGPMAYILNEIRDTYPGHFQSILYTMSASMEGGQQGKMLQLFYKHGVKKFLDKHAIDQDPVISTNDVTSRHMVKTQENGVRTRKALTDPAILSALHAEGWMQGGRKIRGTEVLNGLQEMDRSVRALFINQVRSKTPTIIVPVGIEGSEEIFDPNSKNFTIDGLITLTEGLEAGTGLGQLQDKLFSVFGGGQDLRYIPNGVVRIGRPQYLSDLAGGVKDIPDGVMRAIAEVLSPRYQGDYGRKLVASG